jgi:hypothetical protein
MIPPRITWVDCPMGDGFLDIPQQAAVECSAPGPCDGAVEYWEREAGIRWPLASAMRRDLAEYGCWDDLDTVEEEVLRRRYLWVAAGNWRDAGEEEPTTPSGVSLVTLFESLGGWEASCRHDPTELSADTNTGFTLTVRKSAYPGRAWDWWATDWEGRTRAEGEANTRTAARAAVIDRWLEMES